MECNIILNFSGIKKRYVLTSDPEAFKNNKDKFKKGDVIVEVPKDYKDKEIETVSDVVDALAASLTSDKQKKDFRLALANASTGYNKSAAMPRNKDGVQKGQELLSNCTFERLASLFPNELKALKPREDYNISLIDKARINGRDLEDRFFINGKPYYVLRNEDDVYRFAVTEKKKNLIDEYIVGDKIKDDKLKSNEGKSLKSLYEDKLNIVLNSLRKSKSNKLRERIKYEQGEELTLHSLLIDYLCYKSDYTGSDKLIESEGKIISPAVVLGDFCTDLNHDQLIYDESESQLAAALRDIHYKRERLKKKSLYILLSKFVKDFSKKMPQEKFALLDKEGVQKLLEPIFKGDLALQNFEVKSVDKTRLKQKNLTNQQIISLFKKKVKEYNENDPVSPKLGKGENYNTLYKKLITTVDEAKKFGMDKYTAPNGETYNLTIKLGEDGHTIEYSYQQNALTDLDMIYIKYKGYELAKRGDGTDFVNFGNNTWHVYQKVDESQEKPKQPKVDGEETENAESTEEASKEQEKVTEVKEDRIKDGYYHGFYVYKTNKYGKDEYIFSQSVIFPEIYVRGIFGNAEKAKAAIIRRNKSIPIYKALMLNLKILNTDPDRGEIVIEPKVNLGFSTRTGQTIDSLDVYLSENVYKKLSTAERTIYNSGKLEDVINLYKNPLFGLSESQIQKMEEVLDTPEKAGLLMFKLADLGLSFSTVTSVRERVPEKVIENGEEKTKYKSITGLTSEQSKIFDDVLSQIENAKRKQYVVKRYYEMTSDKPEDRLNPYVTYIQSLGKEKVNADGTIWIEGVDENGRPKRRTPLQSITSQLYTLKDMFNKTLFKDTDISIEITDNDSLQNEEEFKVNGKPIFQFNDEFSPSQIKGFVYNNKIYINESNVSSGVDTMFHEMFHILFGIMRVKDPEQYYKALQAFDETAKGVSSTVNLIKKNYPGLSYYDFKEELAVRQLARMVENGTSMFLPNSSEGKEYSEYQKSVFTDLIKAVNEVKKQVEEAFGISEISDLTLTSSLKTAFKKDKTLADKLARQRMVTNLLEKSIDNESIIEKCKE